MKKFSLITMIALLCTVIPTIAEVNVQMGDTKINVGSDGSVSVHGDGTNIDIPGNNNASVNVSSRGVTAVATEGSEASIDIGGIGNGVNIQGVSVINGHVYIDGEEVPSKVTRYKSPRTGEVYVIRRHGGSVAVTSETEDKK